MAPSAGRTSLDYAKGARSAARQRRAPGVEEALRACAAMGKDMADAFDRLGALPADAFVGEGGEDANTELELDRAASILHSSGKRPLLDPEPAEEDEVEALEDVEI